jgi:two-component system NarL family sensor kinase
MSMGLLAAFFVLIAVRQYRLNALRQYQLLNAVVEAQDSERSRIATDMHDGLGQLLAATKLQTDALRHADETELPDKIKTIKDTLDQASAEVRVIIHDLVPRKLERDGLWEAVEELAKSTGVTEELHVRVTSDGDRGRYPPRIELNLYRIVQELLTNAVRHAHSSEIVIELRYTTQQLQIRVTDNGIGYDTTQTNNDGLSGGNGLRNVASRTAWLHGAVSYSRNQQGGTCVLLTFDVRHLRDRA